MTAQQALETLSANALRRFHEYAATIDPADPEAFDKLHTYAEALSEWLSASMRPIIEAARPRVLH